MIVLDSGAVTALAHDTRALRPYEHRLLGTDVIIVPSPVLVECRTGSPRRDTAVDRLLKRVRVDERISERLTRTAAVLRTAARRGSAIDALVVAYAEPDGRVITGDLGDLRALAAYAKGVAIEGI